MQQFLSRHKTDDMLAVLKHASLDCLLQLWCHAIALLAEVILDGVSRIKGRCSAIGRNAMITDLQVKFPPFTSAH